MFLVVVTSASAKIGSTFFTSKCNKTSCSVLYFSRANREVVVTMTLDAMENRLYRTFLHFE